MAFRQIKSTFTIATTSQPQPLLGSWITAGAGITAPAGMPFTVTLGTATSSGNDATNIFVAGELALLVDPNGSHMEVVRIQSVLNNTVTLGNSTDMSAQGGNNPVTRFPHVAGAIGTGTWIMPKQIANNVLVMYEDGGTGPFLYIGCSPLMTATAYRVFKLTSTAVNTSPTYYSAGMLTGGNPFDVSEWFVLGTSGDKYLPTIVID